MNIDIDGIVRGIRELANLARAAEEGWRDATTLDTDGETRYETPPDDERQVLIFQNGHASMYDAAGRNGGGWGIAMGYHDKQKGWMVHGWRCDFVTHWRELPPAPKREEES